jgi:zinc/manganese transport system substrate-binding protein
MQRRFLLGLLGAVPLAAHAAGASLKVVASFSILADLTQQVGGGAVSVVPLVGPDGDVHVYEPRPKDLRTVMSAGVLVRNGLGLEGWMDRLTQSAGFSGRIVVASEKVRPRTMIEAGGSASVDPHAWQDPANAALYVQEIADGLGAADAANAAAYRDRAALYKVRVEQMDRWIAAQFAEIPTERRRIITTHDAFGYFGARYGIEFLSAEGISTEFEPSAKSIATLVKQIKRENVRAVFIENMTSPRFAQMIGHETGAVLGGTVYSDALSPQQGPAASYLDMLKHNTTLFAGAMRTG